MSDHYTKYPVAGNHQHSGLGNSSEPIETIKIESFYDEAGCECGSLLTFKGQTHAENWHSGSYPLWNLLLHNGSGRTGSLCPPQGLFHPKANEGRAEGEVHADSSDDSGQASVCGYKRGSCLSPMFGHDREDCGIKYPPKVHLRLFIICLAVVLTAVGAYELLAHIWKAVVR